MSGGTVTDNDKAFRELQREIAKLAKAVITVGVHGDERDREDGGIDNVQLAAVHEFGSPAQGIPARSFLRAAIDEHLSQLRSVGGELAAQVAGGTLKTASAAAQLGAFTVGLIQARMAQGLSPPLSPATLRRRAQRFKKGRAALATINRLGKSAKLTAKGSARLAKARAIVGNAKPLIDTGQLRQSIAFKVKL